MEEKKEVNKGMPKEKGEESELSSFPIADARDIEELKKQLEDCQKLKDEYLAGWQRARADMLNHKKEEMERVGDLLGYAKIEFVLNLLPILDNFEIVEKNLTENLKKDDNVKGLLLIKSQIEDFLKNQGLEEIKTIGEKLDLNLHEVIGEAEVKDQESGTVVEQIQKGYTINGRLLRPTKVKVAK